MIQAHNEMPTGIKFCTLDTKSKIMHHDAVFVDGRKGHVPGNSEEENRTKDLSA
jgi:hypothetical protein